MECPRYAMFNYQKVLLPKAGGFRGVKATQDKEEVGSPGSPNTVPTLFDNFYILV